jgi:hypothetical protein
MVVIAGNDDGRDTRAAEFSQEVVDEPLGLWRRCRRIENITGQQQGIHVLASCNLENLV